MKSNQNVRILIIDDNAEVQQDFIKILTPPQPSRFNEVSAKIFNKENTPQQDSGYELCVTSQGAEAIASIKNALEQNNPFALAFVDIRMPPGLDGIETIKQIWELDPNVQIVLCTAYSDYSFEEIRKKLKNYSNFIILKKPFDAIEIKQLAASLAQKWQLNNTVEQHIQELQQLAFALDSSLAINKSTLESIQEGVIVISNEKRIIFYNNKFLDYWKISNKELIESKDDASVLIKYLAQQLENSELFLTLIESLDNNSKIIIDKELQLKTGQFYELYAQPHYLNEKIIGVVLSFQDITDRKSLEGELKHHATHDGLTNLPNRVLLLDRIQQAINQAKRLNRLVAVLLVDLDNFKEINDTYGHSAGDKLLQGFTAKMKKILRETDTVARLGGDEFVIVLPAVVNDEEIDAKCSDLLKLSMQDYKIENTSISVSASIGVSTYPDDGITPEILLKNADIALYRAKEMGRSNYQFYMTAFTEHLLQKSAMTNALQKAITNNQLSLKYQPLISLETEEIIGVEALLRWTHPTLGVIEPEKFIMLAEQTGLISTIGEWVLRTACAQMKIWQETINPDLCIAVNISVHQFRNPNFVKMVRKILRETHFDPKYLELEITESLLLGNSEEITDKMAELKKLGVNFAIDDFGTGYSSLSYLRYLPLDKIKIDKSFIGGMLSNSDDSSIVTAIVNMTKSMGLEVLAEGVEKKEQVEFLRNINTTQIQGYYYSPPLDEKSFLQLLKSKKKEFV